MMKLHHAIALVPGMFLCLSAWSQQNQNNQQQVPDSVLKDKKDLQTVIVTGRKPLVTRKPDRFIINVENSYLANGNNGLEVLQKSPGIWVDQNGVIRVKGNQGVTVMINDVIQRMPGEELAEYLRSLKSEEISRIEVITNPPAEYEAAGTGGIVHIVLKKARKVGYSGFIGTQYKQQGSQPYYLVGGSIDYKIKRWYLSGAYSYAFDKRPVKEQTDMFYPDKSEYHNYSDRTDKTERNRYRFGLGIDLSRNQFIDIQNFITPYTWSNLFNSDIRYSTGSQQATGIGRSVKYRQFNFASSIFSYLYRLDTLGSKFTILAEYTGNKKKESGEFEERYSGILPDTSYSTRTPFATDLYSAQADWTKMINSLSSIRTGAKYVNMQRDNEFITKEMRRFLYNEQLWMGYANAERTLNRTSIKAGLRVEYTIAAGNNIHSGKTFNRRYLSFFPAFSVMQKLKEKKDDALFFTYSRRIRRPELNELNPERIPFSNYTSVTGDPNLKPMYTHSIETGYNFWHGYSASLYFLASSNLIDLLVNQGAGNAIDYIFTNFGNAVQYGLNLAAPVQITKNWSANNNCSVFHIRYNFPGRKLDQTAFAIKTAHSITIPSLFDVEAIAGYRSPREHAGYKNPEQFSFDMGFSKKLWKKRLNVKLYVEDIFNTLREYEVTDAEAAQTIFYRKRATRTVSLSLTYTFKGGLKFTSRKIESGGDERNRAG